MANYDTDILIQNIRSLMDDKGMNQEQLAQILGMSQPNVSKALNLSDKKSFTLDQVVGIANYFNVSVDVLIGKRKNTTIATGPRAIASFLSEILASHKAEIVPYEHDEVVFEVDYDNYTYCPSSKIENRTVTYPAIYFPGYWEVPEQAINEDTAYAISEATQCGNETAMQPINDFLRHFKEIFDLYDKGGLTEDTYNAVLSDMINHLRE